MHITYAKKYSVNHAKWESYKLSEDFHFGVKIASIFQNTFNGYRAEVWQFKFSDEEQIYIPLVRIASRQMISNSLPYNWNGCLYSSSDHKIARKIDLLSKKIGSNILTMSFASPPYEQLDLPKLFDRHMNIKCLSVKSYYTDLSAGDFEKIFQTDFSSKTRNQCRKALKSGIDFKKSKDEGDILAYFEHYMQNVSKWRKDYNSYPLNFFKELIHLNKVDFWIAKKDEAFLGGIIILKYEKWVYYWAGVVNREFSKLSANNGLLYTALQHYTQNHYKIFDYGPSEGLESVEKFKAGFGPKVRRHFMLTYRSNFNKYIIHPINSILGR
ncbi:MAG: GNAT family N-acetyltransferase [Fulvivirga sp.]